MKRIGFVFFIILFGLSSSFKRKNKNKKTKPSKKTVTTHNKTTKEKPHLPHVLVASNDLAKVQFFSVKKYRVFKTNAEGEVFPIPFQIDEKDDDSDYILEDEKSDFFDGLDELSFMSQDAGPDIDPKTWSFKKPEKLYKIYLSKKDSNKVIYIGIYSKSPPPKESLSQKKYVSFDIKENKIQTSKYKYIFNNKNYLMVRDFYLDSDNSSSFEKLLTTSTFYLKLNLKYFFSLSINHKDIDSDLEAYKVGPVRTIARVNFNYKIMAMKFDLGMYTEVVFFENAIFLPAVLENPIDGKKLLKKDSDFYYGFAMVDNPGSLQIESNMEPYPEENKLTSSKRYWLSTVGNSFQLYLEFEPSVQMIEDKILPNYFIEKKSAKQILKRSKKPRPLGKSTANIAITLDMHGLSEAVHEVDLALFIDNQVTPQQLKEFKEYKDWKIRLVSL